MNRLFLPPILLFVAFSENFERSSATGRNRRALQNQDISDYHIIFKDCVTTSSLNSLSNNNDLICQYSMNPPSSDHQTTLHAYEDCSSPAPPTVSLTESTNVDGEITAIIDLVRGEIGKVVNESNGGSIRFCVRTDVMELVDGEVDSVNFVKARVAIEIDLDGNFEIQPILLTEEEIGEMSFLKEYGVYAYQCHHSTGIPTPSDHVISQGEIMAVCVEASGESADTFINEVMSWRLMQRDPSGGLPLVIVPVQDGAPTILSNYDCSLNDGSKCIIRTIVITMFFDNVYEFENVQDGVINTTGVVDLRIRGDRRLASDTEIMEEYGNVMMYFNVPFTIDKLAGRSFSAAPETPLGFSRLLMIVIVGNAFVSASR